MQEEKDPRNGDERMGEGNLREEGGERGSKLHDM